jgi:hypothetical protein
VFRGVKILDGFADLSTNLDFATTFFHNFPLQGCLWSFARQTPAAWQEQGCTDAQCGKTPMVILDNGVSPRSLNIILTRNLISKYRNA